MTTHEQDVEYEGLVAWLRTNVDAVIDLTPDMRATMDQALVQHRDRVAEFGVDLEVAEERRAYLAGIGHGVGSVLTVAMAGRLSMNMMQELVHRIGFPYEIEDQVGYSVGLPPDPFEERP